MSELSNLSYKQLPAEGFYHQQPLGTNITIKTTISYQLNIVFTPGHKQFCLAIIHKYSKSRYHYFDYMSHFVVKYTAVFASSRAEYYIVIDKRTPSTLTHAAESRAQYDVR